MEDKNKNDSKGSMPNIGGVGVGKGGQRFMAPVQKPKNLKGTLRRLWAYMENEKKFLLIVFGIVLIEALIALIVPYLIGRAIDSMTSLNGKVNFKALKVIITGLIVAYTTNAFIIFFQGFTMAGVSQRIIKSLRNALFEKMQKLPVSFFDTRSHGEIMSRLTNDIDNVSTTISQSTTQLMNGVLTITGSFIMMVILSPILTLAALITVPLVFLLTKTISKKTKMFFKRQQKSLGDLNGHIEENISGFNVVKAFNQEEKVIANFEKINGELCEVGIKAQIWSGLLMPVMNVINNIGFTMVAAIGGVLAVNDMITVGVIASFISYSRQFTRPLNDLANIFNTLQSAIAGAERVFEMIDEAEEIEDCENATNLEDIKGKVVFENVSFGYREDVKIFKDISFEVKEGDTIALVGPTGAGKTTIVNLISRFYDVSGGKILIDDKDIKEYTRDSLRKAFGIVLQDTYLFSGTIKENIKYGNLQASDDEVIKAAKMANAHSFIKRLPKGYDTILTESGGNLSQGQRQLLAIARAILADPPILILDEATSSVDTRTELQIQDGMIKLMNGRTSFIIAHRLSTIKDANIIMVIENGTIVEKGSHEELIKNKGLYSNMYFSQFKNMNIS